MTECQFALTTVTIYGGNPHANSFENTASEVLQGLYVHLLCFPSNCVSAYLYAKDMHWNNLLSDESIDNCAAPSLVLSLLI